jgi:hypothetical protein
MKKSTGFLLLGGGALTIGGVLLAWRKSAKTAEAVEQAVSGNQPPPLPGQPDTRGQVTLKLTHYWPFTARPDEQLMEGAPVDRKGQPLHTVEDFLAGKSDYVSLAGDYTIFPYGQKILIPWGNKTLVGRVVDTGGHFHGGSKLYRVTGAEPIDVCVFDRKSAPPKSVVVGKIVAGDNFDSGKSIAAAGLKGQTIMTGTVLGGEVLDAHTNSDVEALARAIESELGGQRHEEQRAAAWAMRNRAAASGVTLSAMLVPLGVYGPSRVTGGYASTRKAPTPGAIEVATEVLDSPASADPTGGAVEFWIPQLQTQMHELASLYSAAVRLGDRTRAEKYERFAGYGSEVDIRARQEEDGLQVTCVVGAVELLGKVSG